MFCMDTKRRVAALAVIVALVVVSPLAAAGWDLPARWESAEGFFMDGFTRVLAWLDVKPVLKSAPPCDHGGSIDPNGCPKALVGAQGASIDPNGATTGRSLSIGPNGL